MVVKIPTHTHKSGSYAIGQSGSSFTREIVLVNPQSGTHRYPETRWVLWFGAIGSTCLMVWADSLDDALEEAAGWLADHAPGHIMARWGEEHTALVKEACEEAGLAWPMPEGADEEEYYRAFEEAEADLTYTESGYLTSYEWGILAEDPTRAELIELIGGAS